MSVLVILLPPKPRGASGIPAAGEAATAPAAPAREWSYVFSSDGQAVTRQGTAAAAALPRATSVCALLPDADLSWQRLTVPKAPPARRRAALGALLEDALLEDEDQLHLALQAGASAGQPGWVAVTDKAWLREQLAALQAAGLAVDRVLPASWPAPQATVHALPATTGGDADAATLVWSHADGVALLQLGGSLARQRLGQAERSTLRCSAHPSVVASAERWFEAPVAVLGEGERALAAVASPWNLRQFDLAPRHRGWVAVREAVHQLGSPEWRPLRLGLVALLLLQVLGLNLWAWRLDQTVADKRQATARLLQQTHPQVRSVLDAPVQMQRETELLRSSAGQPGPGDLEALLAVAAAAWPDGQGPLQALRFEPGRLSITPGPWAEAQHTQFADRLRAAGYRAETQGAQVIVSREVRS